MRILFVHLLNNFTGSPRVLSNFLLEFSNNKGNEIHIITSKTKGCLSDIKNIKYHKNLYKWTEKKFFLFFYFCISQIYQFFFILFSKKFDCIYINTILPFGAALAARLRKEKVIYHIHEYYSNPNIMQKICLKCLQKTANKVVFVSYYLQSCYKQLLINKDCVVIHNAISKQLYLSSKKNITKDYIKNKFLNRIIVLPCALKKYKGVLLFLELARKMPNYNFLLVTSNSKQECTSFFKNENIPINFGIKNEVDNMSDIYRKAGLVVNLTIPYGEERVIESFSMILIEAFAFKTPCIAPCYGGPLEIIQNKKNGLLMEINNLNEVISRINEIFSSYSNYLSYSENAYTRASDFCVNGFIQSISQVIEGV